MECQNRWSGISWDFHVQQSQEFAENGVKNKQNVTERGQRRRARLVEADRKVTGIQITMHYNSGMQKSISDHTTLKPLSG